MTRVNLDETRVAEVERLNEALSLHIKELSSLLDDEPSALSAPRVPLWPPNLLAPIFRRSARRKREASDARDEIATTLASADSGDAGVIARLAHLVVELDNIPNSFPNKARTAFLAASKQLAIEYDLPNSEVVPEATRYNFVKSRREITMTKRPATQRRELYATTLAALTLRILRNLFAQLPESMVETIAFNGHVHTVDLSTGHDVHPCIVSVRVDRASFAALELKRVEPIICLRSLGAAVSSSPSQLSPVRPLLDLSMVDPRFVASDDVLSQLDGRPNLMDLSPNEFEHLITNLFEKMGLETRQTQASRDGGVDCVAYNTDPVLGGKVVIQAKRYRHTVGVSAVRDLYGTVQNEGASKGILVTTSGYGPAAFEFANNKPLELLEGSHLLYLLAEHAGIEARIEIQEISAKGPL